MAKTGFEEYRTAGDADRVVILDILISFRGADSKIKATRTKEEAKALADEVLHKFTTERMSFTELAEFHSDHRHPATGQLTYIYSLTNYGVKPKPVGEYAREQLHTGWGDVAFGLRLGGAVVAAHSMRESAVNGRAMLPDGWHVMYRAK
ncbi:MAG: peptidylprolyl isomerase [Planctomycetota bacterium]